MKGVAALVVLLLITVASASSPPLPPTQVSAPFLHGDDPYDANGWRETVPGMVLRPDGKIELFYMRKSDNHHSPGDQKPDPRGRWQRTDGYGYSAAGCVDCELRSALSSDHGRRFDASAVSPVMPLPKTAGDNETLRPAGWWARGGVTVAAPPPGAATQEIHLFMGKYVATNLTAAGHHYMLTVWHLMLHWNGSSYSPAAAAPSMVARDDDNGTPRSAVQLPSGRLIYGHAASPQANKPNAVVDGLVYGVMSDDRGHTWHRSRNPQRAPAGYELVEMGLAMVGPVASPASNLLAFMRSEHDPVHPSLWTSHSTDQGESFTPPAPRNATGKRLISDSTPATPLRLRDGRLVLMWCNGLTANQRYPTRQMLHAAISESGGRAFTRGYREIFRSIFSSTNFSGRTDYGAGYPFAIETAVPGRLLVATGQGFASQTLFLVDVDWITTKTQRADYLQAPPPPATPLFPAIGCNIPPCKFNSHGQLIDPRDFSGNYGSTFSFGDPARSIKPSIRPGRGLTLTGNSTAWVYNVPATGGEAGGGRLWLNVSIASSDIPAGGGTRSRSDRSSTLNSMVVALTDRFAEPVDATSDAAASPAGCAVTIGPIAQPLPQHGRLRLLVEWTTTGAHHPTCVWTVLNCPGVKVTPTRAGAGPFEAALSYVRVRPIGDSIVTVQGAEVVAT